MFAKRRHVAQTFLDIALLVNNVSHFVSVWMTETPSHLKPVLIGLIVGSIVLQVIAAIILCYVTGLYQLLENREMMIIEEEKNDQDQKESSQNGQEPCGCLWYSSVNKFETSILIMNWLATGIILVITVLNVFISTIFPHHLNQNNGERKTGVYGQTNLSLSQPV